jgi:hypothetical protein
MNGRIVIDGFCRNGTYEIISHGGKQDPEAVCSLTYSVRHNVEVTDILSLMRQSIQNYIDADCDECRINSINRAIQEAGKPPLDPETVKVILNATVN